MSCGRPREKHKYDKKPIFIIHMPMIDPIESMDAINSMSLGIILEIIYHCQWQDYYLLQVHGTLLGDAKWWRMSGSGGDEFLGRNEMSDLHSVHVGHRGRIRL